MSELVADKAGTLPSIVQFAPSWHETELGKDEGNI